MLNKIYLENAKAEKNMPEVKIKYNNPKTLRVLKVLAKHFDFVIKNDYQIRGVSITSTDKSINITELENVFSNKDINVRTLRNEVWQRKKQG